MTKKDNNKEETSIVPAGMESHIAEFKDMLTALAGPGGIDTFSLPRITLKHAGTQAFGIEDIEEDDEERIEKSFDAAILYLHPVRVYWSETFAEREGKDVLPACVSLDGIAGLEGDTQAQKMCIECEFAQWGSGEGRGQACRERIRMFVLPKDTLLPHVLEAPTTSIKIPRRYALQLFGKGLDVTKVLTHFGVKGASNRDNIEYSQLAMTLKGKLDPADVERLAPMREVCAQMAQRLPVGESVPETSAEDFDDPPEETKKEVFPDE